MSDEKNIQPQDELSDAELEQVSGGDGSTLIGQAIGAKSAEGNEEHSATFYPGFTGGVRVASGDVND
jgi:bacteriocin-like protein